MQAVRDTRSLVPLLASVTSSLSAVTEGMKCRLPCQHIRRHHQRGLIRFLHSTGLQDIGQGPLIHLLSSHVTTVELHMPGEMNIRFSTLFSIGLDRTHSAFELDLLDCTNDELPSIALDAKLLLSIANIAWV